MKVRLTQQVSGTRDGRDWPPAGTVVDLPDVEARALVNGGAATAEDTEVGTVLVPPDGIHTPGTAAHTGVVQLVEAPADASMDPDATQDALKARAEGNMTEVPVGTGVQAKSGAALTPDAVKASADAEKQTQEDLAAGALPKVGESAPKSTSKSSGTSK